MQLSYEAVRTGKKKVRLNAMRIHKKKAYRDIRRRDSGDRILMQTVVIRGGGNTNLEYWRSSVCYPVLQQLKVVEKIIHTGRHAHLTSSDAIFCITFSAYPDLNDRTTNKKDERVGCCGRAPC